MSPKAIQAGKSYVNRGAGRTKRTVNCIFGDSVTRELMVRFQQQFGKQGLREYVLSLESFAQWAGKEVA